LDPFAGGGAISLEAMRRREPGLPKHEAIVPEEPKRDFEIGGFADEPDDGTVVAKDMDRKLHASARQAALDRGDGLDM
jgi:hypothetical protein